MVNKGEARQEASMRPETYFPWVAEVTKANGTMSRNKAKTVRTLPEIKVSISLSC